MQSINVDGLSACSLTYLFSSFGTVINRTDRKDPNGKPHGRYHHVKVTTSGAWILDSSYLIYDPLLKIKWVYL